jgi:hypothetical protein
MNWGTDSEEEEQELEDIDEEEEEEEISGDDAGCASGIGISGHLKTDYVGSAFTTVNDWLDSIEDRFVAIRDNSLRQLSVLAHLDGDTAGMLKTFDKRFSERFDIDRKALTELRLQRWTGKMFVRKAKRDREELQDKVEWLTRELQESQNEVARLTKDRDELDRFCEMEKAYAQVESDKQRKELRALRAAAEEERELPRKLPKLVEYGGECTEKPTQSTDNLSTENA